MRASRLMLLGAVESAIVTHVAFEDAEGLSLDADVAEAAGFLEHEKVELYDVTTGARLSVQVRFAARGSGLVALGGAAAHLVKPGELVTLSTFGWMKAKAAAKHQPVIVQLDDENHLQKPKR